MVDILKAICMAGPHERDRVRVRAVVGYVRGIRLRLCLKLGLWSYLMIVMKVVSRPVATVGGGCGLGCGGPDATLCGGHFGPQSF